MCLALFLYITCFLMMKNKSEIKIDMAIWRMFEENVTDEMERDSFPDEGFHNCIIRLLL